LSDRIAHGQYLSLKNRAGVTQLQVQAQGLVVWQRQIAVFARNHQRSDFLAGAVECNNSR
jgi:hypothetical protein